MSTVRGSMFKYLDEGKKLRAKQQVDDNFEKRYESFKETVAARLKNHNDPVNKHIYVSVKCEICEDLKYMEKLFIERFNEDTETFGGFSININIYEFIGHYKLNIRISWQ